MFKKILSDSVVYGFSRIIVMGVSMFLVPIYSRMFSRAQYGIIETFNTLTNILFLLLTAGILSSVYRFVNEKSEDEKKKYYSTIYIYFFGLAIVVTIIAYFARSFMSQALISDHGHANIFVASVVIGCVSAVTSLNLDICRSQFKKVHYLILSVGSGLTLATLGILFVLKLRMGVMGFFYAGILTQLTFLIFGTLLNRKSLIFHFSLPILKQVLLFSFPFIPAALGGTLAGYMDRIVLLKFNVGTVMQSLDHLGIYSMSLRMASIFDLVGIAFSNAWYPWAMKVMTQPDAKKIYSNMFDNIIILFVFAGGLFSSVQIFVLYIFADHKFLNAFQYVYMMTFASVVLYSAYVLNLGIIITKRTKFVSIPTLLSAFVNLCVSILLVKRLGITGVNIAFVLAAMTSTFLGWYFSNRYYPIKFHFFRNFVSLTILAVWQVAIYITDKTMFGIIWINIVIKIGLAVFFISAFYFLNANFREKSTGVIKALYNRYIRKQAELTTS